MKDKGTQSAITLLKELIKQPSFSREEDATCLILSGFLEDAGIPFERHQNNIWCRSESFREELPTLLLNSHHDTVKPNAGYTKDPFTPEESGGKIFGLGSNDAGGALVCLLHTFLGYFDKSLPFNVIFAATAEEEISGANGIASLLPKMPRVDFGIVGEPTEMKAAVAEKGLVVADCTVYGEAGHAARKNGKNAIELSLEDLLTLREMKFDKVSEMLGEVNLSVTQINAGTQHNVIPDRCQFVLDIRTTDAYNNNEVIKIIQAAVKAEVVPRSLRLQPSGIGKEHPLFRAVSALGWDTFGSPTLSDQALMPFPTMKIGPGKSERSHTADEFIYLDEIEEGLQGYRELIDLLKQQML